MSDAGVLISGQTRIPVRNLWLLMLYASDLFAADTTLQDVGEEQAQDDLPDLVAEVLVSATERRLHRPLSHRHLPTNADLTRVRGRIDHLHTITRGLTERGRIACIFDDRSKDHPVNQTVLAALDAATRVASRADLRERAASAARVLVWSGVRRTRVTALETAGLVLGRNDEAEGQVVSAALLLLRMCVLTEDPGLRRGATPERDIARWRRLFESAVRGFFAATRREPWRGEPGQSTHHWPVQDPTPGMSVLLPTMTTDVVLRGPGRRILVETKFAAPTAVHTRFGNETFRREHLFQLHAYLTTVPPATGERIDGVLLYPQIDRLIDERAVFGKHGMRIMTVDLGGSARQIRERLLEVLD